MYFNMHLTHSIFFRYGAVEIIAKQEKDLKKIHEVLLLKKLKLGKSLQESFFIPTEWL